ncbi:uncharacterized protein LOC116204846 [Punica granatum]|uniref:Uncharacterized protein n=2 Tax=Punica granatum TaxID=22663 RepID=A0A218XJD8_PUNGR|nr:uncharacterized protein LOC116204846 [Punica granatum]OWM85024.1 hypothetical protein CDL15_Pgr027811 [Punica granatum]PKI58065.1 hypothetical protein CRG98_021558 [Punica granatum]
MARHQVPLTRIEFSAAQMGFMAMTVLLCAFALFMCASHSRRRKQWNECYGFFDEEPVTIIELHNENAVVEGQIADEEEETVFNGEAVWQKNILMGGKCQLPDFSGVIIYDAEGNVVTPATTPRLTWK